MFPRVTRAENEAVRFLTGRCYPSEISILEFYKYFNFKASLSITV